MTDILKIYIIASVLIGAIYFYYYINSNDLRGFKKLPMSQKLGMYLIIFIVPSLFAPYTLYELIKIIINKNKNGGIK